MVFFQNVIKCTQFQVFELTQKVLRSLTANTHLGHPIRRKLAWQYSRLCFLYSFVFIKNQCIVSGRFRSVYSFFNLSRLVIKEFFKMNKIPYLLKSS
jgi:ribosomal protein S14